MNIRMGFSKNRNTYIKLFNNGGFTFTDEGQVTNVETFKTLAIYLLGYYANIDFLHTKLDMLNG